MEHRLYGWGLLMFGDVGPKLKTYNNVPPYSMLGNGIGAVSPLTNVYGLTGAVVNSTTTGTVTLTNASASIQYFSSLLTGAVTVSIPLAATCPGKTFIIYRFFNNGSNTFTLNRSGSDIFSNISNASFSSIVLGPQQFIMLTSDGVGAWYESIPPVLPVNAGGTGSTFSAAIGALIYANTSNSLLASTAGTAGQLWQANGAAAPTATSTPGSGTPLATITATHQIAGGTAPTVAAGAGAGTGGSVGATITGHDTDCLVTVTTGATGTASGVLATVTFGTTYASGPYIQLTPANAAAAGLIDIVSPVMWYATSTITTGVINLNGAPAANTTYAFNMHCGQ